MRRLDAVREDDAEPRGYISRYPPGAARCTTLPADARRSLDRGVVEAQMLDSFLNDRFNKDLRDGFRVRFRRAIEDIGRAATTGQRTAAIERYNQAARDYNAAELVERDNFAGHPTDPAGRTVREEPKSMSDPTTAPNRLPTAYGQMGDSGVCQLS